MMDPAMATADGTDGTDDVLMDVTSPSTALHLQTLPPFLQPISPSLAALHMARMRLLCQITPSASFLSRWCTRCGALRAEKLGGPSKRRKSVTLPLGRQMGRTTSFTDVGNDEEGMDVDAPGEPESAYSGTTADEIPEKKSKPLCAHCGLPFIRPKPDRSTLALFSSARRTRAVRKAALDDSAFSTPTISLTTLPDIPSAPAPALGLSLDGSIPPVAGTKARPTLLQTPSLAYVPKENPNPPSYPQPPPAAGVKRAGSPDAGKSKKRKMKKSGLARLLAESKGREEASKATGRWGFD